MSDIILVQPKLGYVDSFIFKNTLPSALLSISRLIDKEYKVKIIDQRLDKDWKKHLLKELNQNSLCIATSCITGMPIKYALEISKFVKINSNIPVIWGGKHPTILPEQCLKNKNIDLVVRGEGEITFYELVKALDKNKPLKNIKGISYKKNRKITHNSDREFVDLNKLPPLPYHLIDIKHYLTKRLNIPSLYMETSRGCPNNCGFCYNKIMNKCKWRALNVENVIRNIKQVVDDFKINNLFFTDDNFFVNLKRAKDIAKGIITEKFDLIWDLQGGDINYLSKLNNKSLKLLEKSGCSRLTFGVESGSERILNLIDKKISPQQVLDFNKRLSKYEIKANYNFIAGFPTETISDLKKSVNLSLKILKQNKYATISNIVVYTPYPGTNLYPLALKQGLKQPKKLEGWVNYNTDTVNLPWLSKKRKKLVESLFICSLFIDNKFMELNASKIIKLIAKIYGPIAKARFKNMFFWFMIEKTAYNLFKEQIQK